MIHAPVHVTTDSHQRLIVSDPSDPAVLILDGSSALRIQGGPGYRLHRPGGVAVDKDDNIYVADSEAGIILVYSPDGLFLRALGTFKGEPVFQRPTAIAIDRELSHLYVLDTPPSEVIELDLEGNVLARAGGWRNIRGVHLEFPSEIALRGSAVVVLDLFGTRVSVLDLDCRPVHAFSIRPFTRPRLREIGLAIDSAGNIYVSDGGADGIRSFTRKGQMVGVFGKFAGRPTDFAAPLGMWVDAADHIYVADTQKGRIVVFHHPPLTAPPVAADGPEPPAAFSALHGSR